MAKTTTKATLGNLPLLRSSQVKWELIEGVRAYMAVFALRPKDAEELLKNNDRPVSLIIEPKSGVPTKIDYLYVLREAPGDNPRVRKVLVADRRWMWDHNVIDRDYNVRRNVGNLRTLIGNERQLDVTSPDVRYWPWSLHEANNGASGVWLPSEIIKDILTEVLQTEKTNFSINVPFSIFTDGAGDTDRVPIEGMTIKEGGAVALGRVISSLPGVGIKVEPNGEVVVYLKSGNKKGDSPAAPASLSTLGIQIDGFGSIVSVNNRLMRPRRIIFKYLREVETRFDSVVEFSRNQTVAEPGKDTRFMVNVGQVTEPFLKGTDFQNPEGTWMPFDTIGKAEGLIDAWPNRAGFKVTQEYIRRALLPFAPGLWETLLLAGIKNPNVDWAGRIAMLERCFRRTFQINWRWMSKIRSMRAYRVAVVNQATGARAPASVYSDYAVLPSKRGMMAKTEGATDWVPNTPGEQYVYANVAGYVDSNPSPAHVKIVDEDQGIILVDYQLDPMGLTKSIVPSIIDNNPNMDIRNPTYGPVTADALPEGGTDFPAMSAGYRVKVIFTCVPASPNNDQKLHNVVVTPAQVEAALGYKLGECVGPEMEVYIGPNVCTCKILWDDDRVNDIEKCFGIGVGQPNLTGLILNEGASTPGTGASLNTVSLAHACAIYGSLVNRVEGSQAGYLNPNVKLEGWAASVAHTLSTQGHLRTILTYPGQIPKLSIAAFLDANTRSALYKLAQPSAVV